MYGVDSCVRKSVVWQTAWRGVCVCAASWLPSSTRGVRRQGRRHFHRWWQGNVRDGEVIPTDDVITTKHKTIPPHQLTHITLAASHTQYLHIPSLPDEWMCPHQINTTPHRTPYHIIIPQQQNRTEPPRVVVSNRPKRDEAPLPVRHLRVCSDGGWVGWWDGIYSGDSAASHICDADDVQTICDDYTHSIFFWWVFVLYTLYTHRHRMCVVGRVPIRFVVWWWRFDGAWG